MRVEGWRCKEKLNENENMEERRPCKRNMRGRKGGENGSRTIESEKRKIR